MGRLDTQLRAVDDLLLVQEEDSHPHESSSTFRKITAVVSTVTARANAIARADQFKEQLNEANVQLSFRQMTLQTALGALNLVVSQRNRDEIQMEQRDRDGCLSAQLEEVQPAGHSIPRVKNCPEQAESKGVLAPISGGGAGCSDKWVIDDSLLKYEKEEDGTYKDILGEVQPTSLVCCVIK